jgi:hypothetical protein
MHYLSGGLIPVSIGSLLGSSAFYSSKSETLGMYNNWMSNMTGVLGAATLGLSAAAPSPSGNAGCHINDDLVISAKPTHCNPHTIMQFPSIFNPALGEALDAVATHLISPPNLQPPMVEHSSTSRWCARRKMSATTERKARTIRPK